MIKANNDKLPENLTLPKALLQFGSDPK
jgi:hypothetical protein